MKNKGSIYKDGAYLDLNPTYHVEDSAWKAAHIVKLLRLYNNYDLAVCKDVIEVGCGGGQILQGLSTSGYFSNASYHGYDINPDAIELAQSLSRHIEFQAIDFLDSAVTGDLIVCADVFEHIDDYYGFLAKLRSKGRYFVFNIPLDISLLTTMRPALFASTYKTVGHVHFFTKATALLALQHAGYTVIGHLYAKAALYHFTRKNLTFKKLLRLGPQTIIDRLNEDLSATLLGGYSLVVFAKPS
jgi:SAM-dependent methyltransferase